MDEGDSQTRELIYHILSLNNSSVVHDMNFPGDGSPVLRIVVSVVYCTVAAIGMLGNLLVLHLLCSTRTVVKSTINFFVFQLAVADFLLSLALPFWAVDIAMDYSWPFGLAMCKFVTLLTGINVYASIFFMAAMSFARFCSVATALKPASPLGCNFSASLVTTALLWAGALLFATPRAVFADLNSVGVDNDTTCLYRFPKGTSWLAANHIMRILFGFLVPYFIIMFSYMLLLRFLFRQRLNAVNVRRQANVSKSVAIVVLSFVICWLPYNVLSIWQTLVQLNIADFSPSYYFVQTYIFPLTNCLAFTNACLNPIIYCFLRREYRKTLESQMSCFTFENFNERQHHNGTLAIPLNNMGSQTAQSCMKRSGLPSTNLSPISNLQSSFPINNLT